MDPLQRVLIAAASAAITSAGCGDAPCARFVSRMTECAAEPLPAATSRDAYAQCTWAQPFADPPTDAPPSFEAYHAATFTACGRQASCAEFHACLEQRGCRYLVDTSAPTPAPRLECAMGWMATQPSGSPR